MNLGQWAMTHSDPTLLSTLAEPGVTDPTALTSLATGSAPQSNLLIVVDQRDFVRGCLTCWLETFCSEFTTLAVADVELSLEEAAPRRAAAAVVSVGAIVKTDEWLVHQVGLLRAARPDLPILMIVDAECWSGPEALAVQLGAHAVISVRTTTTKVAAAVLRLVMAGGRYFPMLGDRDRPHVPTGKVRKHQGVGGDVLKSLTPREEMVLTELGRGAQNKDIADQLGMSVSTVKAHVHHIIRKLNVRNRTEVVLAARATQS